MLGMIPLQSTPWLPIWITPLWVLGLGIGVGVVVALVLLVLFAILSRIPGLGTLAENSKLANLVAAVLTAGLSAVLLANYLPQVESKYRVLMILPVVCGAGLVGWGVVYGMWRRTIAEIKTILTEGVMSYVLGVAVMVMVIFLALTPFARDTKSILASFAQVNWWSDGEVVTEFAIPGIDANVDPDDAPFTQRFVDYDTFGVESIAIETNRTILIGDAETPKDFQMAPTRIEPDAPFTWNRGSLAIPPLPGDSTLGVWIQNRELDPATVTFRIVSEPPIREVNSIAITALAVSLFILGYIAFRQGAPRIAAIALATAKSEMAQPLYIVLLGCGLVALVVFMIIPFNTLGEDIKLFKDSGMTLIMVLGLIQAVWSAGTSVSDEIEGRTALTVLSKPVSRRAFLLGKYSGIMMSILVIFMILGIALMVMTAYKPIFEARENSLDQPVWQQSHAEMMSVVPGLVLYFMETMAIGAIGVALATRLAMLANFVVCLTIYVVGNLTSPIVQSSAGNNELVGFVGKLIAVIVPNLNAFNVQAAVDVGNSIPAIYLAGAFNYLVCFAILAFMVALLLFEDRDLA